MDNGLVGEDYVFLGLLGVVFFVWAVVWFRALFGLKRIADTRRRESGVGYFGGIGITVSVFASFLRDRTHRPERRRVFFWTALIFALILFRLWRLG